MDVFPLPVDPKLVTITNTVFGGHPGQYPTVVIGGLFMQGDPLHEDVEKGSFNVSKAIQVVENGLKAAEDTGVKLVISVQGQSISGIIRYISFITEKTEYTGPIFLDAPTDEIRLAGVKYAQETGILDRIVYNSISAHTSEEVLRELRSYSLPAIVLMAHNPQNLWLEGTLDLLINQGLLARAESAGAKGILIDTACMGTMELGVANMALRPVKEACRWPVGHGVGNAIEALVMKSEDQDSTARAKGSLTGWANGALDASPLYQLLDGAYVVSAVIAGADFLLIGHLASAPYLFPMVATINAQVGYLAKRRFKLEIPRDHPFYRFRP